MERKLIKKIQMQASFFLSFSSEDTSHTFFKYIFLPSRFEFCISDQVEKIWWSNFLILISPRWNCRIWKEDNMQKVNKRIARAKNIDNDNGKVKEIRGCGENVEYDDAEVKCFSV